MAHESRIISNIKYNIHNRSNYDIVTDETRDIVDVPYFPAQNLVDVSGEINVYKPTAELYVPFIDQYGHERLLATLNRADARYLFVEFGDNSRPLHYAFAGTSMPQGRKYSSYTYDGRRFYLFGGYSDGRTTNDLWVFDFDKNAWENLTLSQVELSENELPSKRMSASILKTLDKIWVFGGKTDILHINSILEHESTNLGILDKETIIPLNDLWSLDLATGKWTNFDKNRALPHRQGHVVYIDSSIIKLYINGGTNDIGQYEPAGIWTVDIASDTVSFTPYSAPFNATESNILIEIDGAIHVLVGTDLYMWNNATNVFQLKKSNISAINPITKQYWKLVTETKDFGDQSTMGQYDVDTAQLYQEDDTYVETRDINLPPRGMDIPRCNVDNVMSVFYGGLIDNQHFNESTYIMIHSTRHVEKIDFPSDQRPTERVYPSLAYDRYRGRIWLFGGTDGTKFYNDLWYFDIGTKTWHKEHDQLENTDDENPTYPQPRQKGAMCIVATDYLYILNGYSDVKSFNDFWMYHIPTGKWQQLTLVDTIPWGSQYFIFEWRDRLWLYNGQKLYRFFYKIKQFVDQPFLIADLSSNKDYSTGATSGENSINPDDSNQDPIAQFIAQKKYLESPIEVTVVNDRLFVQNPQFKFAVDLDTRILTNLSTQFGIDDYTLWLDRYYGFDVVNLKDYYINVSPLFPLTKNQIPSSIYSGSVTDPIRDGVYFTDYTATTGEVKSTYIDSSGIFKVQRETIEVDKTESLINHTVSIAGTQEDYPSVNFDDANDVWNATIDKMLTPYSYMYSPWYLYSKYRPIGYMYTGAQKVFYNEHTKRAYIVFKNGNMLRVNPVDNTFFTYFTQFWYASAMGYQKSTNKVYCFGGYRNKRHVYMQNGVECDPVIIDNDTATIKELSHCGVMQFDLNMNEINLGSVENYLRENKIQMVDYTQTKEYLMNLVKKYVDGYITNTIPASIDDVKYKIYTATQPIIDDLSQFDFVFEQGMRPYGRAWTSNAQVGDKLYIFGGAQSYELICKMGGEERPVLPNYVVKPTTLQLQKTGNNLVYNPDAEAKKAYVFDMSKRNWQRIADLPEWRYMAGTIVSPDNRYIYIIGGFSEENCTGITNTIYRYDIMKNTYQPIRGIPDNFAPRALPILQWIDEEHLLIQYGINTQTVTKEEDSCKYTYYIHMPVQDAWIFDTRNNLLYKAYEDYSVPMGLVVKDQFFTDEKTSNDVYILDPVPEKNPNGDTILNIRKWDLVHGTVSTLPVIPTSTILEDWTGFDILSKDKQPDEIANEINTNNNNAESIPNLHSILIKMLNKTNFRFRYAWLENYGEYNHNHMFIIGERCEESGVEAVEEMARGHKEAHLRFWYVDLEMPDNNRFLKSIVYDYPLPLSPVALAYDGEKYIYVIYNKYNIWRLNFKKVLEDPSGSWWFQLPPCIDCNFLGDDRTDPKWDSFFIKPNYLVLVSGDGKVARMDTNTFVWFVDKRLKPKDGGVKGEKGLITSTGVDTNEVYMYKLGGIDGKVLNVFEKQWDNFFFDLTVMSRAANLYGDIVNQKLWPTVLRRRRLYTMNDLGHIFYSWLRIDGKYDVEYQLEDFYQGDELRIYGDYTFLQNWNNTSVSVYTIDGQWIDVDQSFMTAVTNEIGWDWDGAYERRYRREFVDTTTNDLVVQYSKCPPNYLKVDLQAVFGGDKPISKVRVKYHNKVKPYNYLTHINKVELITYQTTLAGYDSPTSDTPIEIAHIQPIKVDDVYSNALGITIKNTDPAKSVKNVVTYAWDNEWIQFTLDPSDANSWTIRDQNNPFFLTDELGANQYMTFYIRAVNIDLRPHLKDLVIKGIYAYS